MQILYGFAFSDCGGKFRKQGVGFWPVNTAVGDALSVNEGLTRDEFLSARYEIAFDHDADDIAVAGGDLAGDVVADRGLPGVIFVAVGVTAVNHDARLDAGFLHAGDGVCNVIGCEIHRIPAATQDDVAIRIAGGDEDCGLTVFGVAEEGV